jgi:hypothetical protein
MLIRSLDPNPTQVMRLSQKLRIGTCEEADCELMRNGRTFMVSMPPHHPGTRARTTLHYDPVTRVATIHHPQGAPCGPRCPNEYCPCVNQGQIPGAGGYPHHVQADLPPWFAANGRPIGESEMVDRMGEGVEAIRHIRLRGI